MNKVAISRIERTHRAIIAAAAELFLRQGFLGTSMDEIAAAANVSKQTVYAHFQSKEALFLDIVRGMTGRAGDELQEQVSDPAADVPIEQFLLDFATRQLSIVVTPRLLQLRRLVIAEAGRFPELGRALHERGPMRSINRLVQSFTRYQASGDLKIDDAPAAASFFNWLVMAAMTNDAMLLGDDAIPQADAMEGHAKEAVRIFLSAYGARKPS
ncbi:MULTISPECIES: TetR/AcrR family transcriptional regulator [unclassified Beijerinckia]|uniref:TetR/AcrR family transcriptional regulator n=1 Tax=unclassified Beijerinckia TaxID=2638183 RepID=UPI00089AADA7|nr:MULTISPECIES: TetR/AcrR family transcriptional regulator [unclassified Beijerinckia]MDH7795580.1 TetR/AcrR family transcriptional repressor of mexJK operon [Beijerinckia sp. GAS462]SEC07537.1 transcriptional regulator, TetR family [Beijerinckia sp. 28-YEA-48]